MTWMSSETPPNRPGPYLVAIDCPRGQWVEIGVYQMQDGWESVEQPNTDITDYVWYWMKLPHLPKRMTEELMVKDAKNKGGDIS